MTITKLPDNEDLWTHPQRVRQNTIAQVICDICKSNDWHDEHVPIRELACHGNSQKWRNGVPPFHHPDCAMTKVPPPAMAAAQRQWLGKDDSGKSEDE